MPVTILDAFEEADFVKSMPMNRLLHDSGWDRVDLSIDSNWYRSPMRNVSILKDYLECGANPKKVRRLLNLFSSGSFRDKEYVRSLHIAVLALRQRVKELWKAHLRRCQCNRDFNAIWNRISGGFFPYMSSEIWIGDPACIWPIGNWKTLLDKLPNDRFVWENIEALDGQTTEGKIRVTLIPINVEHGRFLLYDSRMNTDVKDIETNSGTFCVISAFHLRKAFGALEYQIDQGAIIKSPDDGLVRSTRWGSFTFDDRYVLDTRPEDDDDDLPF